MKEKQEYVDKRQMTLALVLDAGLEGASGRRLTQASSLQKLMKQVRQHASISQSNRGRDTACYRPAPLHYLTHISPQSPRLSIRYPYINGIVVGLCGVAIVYPSLL